MQEWEGQLQPSVHAVACRMAYDSEQWEDENRMSEQKNEKVKLNTNSKTYSSLSSQMNPPDGSRACTWLDILGESDFTQIQNKYIKIDK